jgi:GNAT superfamily N-acetyltransferase
MIAPAASASQRADVFAFRYQVLACEQGVADPSIDHVNGTVVDPADATGIVLGAWVEGVLAGTIRLNLLRDGPAPPYSDVLQLTGLPEDERRRLSVTSRLMVSTRWRGTPLGIRLCQAVIRHYVVAELAWDYIVVRPEMERFYTRLGYQRTARNVDFPGVGSLTPLRLNLDPAYLRHTRSVFSVEAVWASTDHACVLKAGAR